MFNKLRIIGKRRTLLITFVFISSLSFLFAQTTPAWVTNLEQAFPSRDWVAVSASGATQQAAEQAAMNALARAFRTDVASLTQASERFSQIVSDSAGKREISFDESQNFSLEVNTSTNIRGLIGVQTDSFRASNGTYYVNARMNRRESAARYAGMVRENAAVIDRLVANASRLPAGFDAYSCLSFAAAIAEVTDNFQNILEVLDATASSRRPGYGGANAIKTRMREVAGAITIGIAVDADERSDTTLITRALGSFFTDKGFKTTEQIPAVGTSGFYVLQANVRFEALTFSERIQSSRYYFDAALEDINRRSVFTFTEDDRKNHNLAAEAKRLALRAVESSVKEGKFATDFDAWLNSLIN